MKLPKYVASEYHELKKLKKKGSKKAKKAKKDTRGTLVDPSAHPRGKGEPR